MYWAPASAHGECDKLANASTIPRPSSKLIKLLTGLRGLMAWPTKNTTVTDLSKLLGMYGLIMTRRRKKGPCGETAGYREALRSRLLFYPNGYRHWHPKMNTEILQFSLPLTLKLVLKGLLKGQCSVWFHPSVPWPADSTGCSPMGKVVRTGGASRSKLDKDYRLILDFSQAAPTKCYIVFCFCFCNLK